MKVIECSNTIRRNGACLCQAMFPFFRLSWPLKLDWRTLWTIKTVNIVILVVRFGRRSDIFLHISCYLHIYAFSLEYLIISIMWRFNVTDHKGRPKTYIYLELERRRKMMKQGGRGGTWKECRKGPWIPCVYSFTTKIIM